MSADSYRGAAERLRRGLDDLGRPFGPCGFCGHPDQRHREAGAIADRLAGGEDAESVALDFSVRGPWTALQLAVTVLAADPRRHGITRAKAAGIDREVWAKSLAGAES